MILFPAAQIQNQVFFDDVRVPVTVVAVASDRLVPTRHLRALAAATSGVFREIDSIYGHDAFLKEPAQIGAILRETLCC